MGGLWLNADGSTSPILPGLTEGCGPTDWAAVATRMLGAVTEAKEQARISRIESDLWRDVLGLNTAQREHLDHCLNAEPERLAEGAVNRCTNLP